MSPGQGILVVEDEDDLRSLIRIVLSDAGYVVHDAATGEEADVLMRKHRPALVLLDLRLPGIGGLELAQKWREGAYPDVVILAHTASVMKGEQALALGAGCDAYLAKPVPVRELLQVIAGFLRPDSAALEARRQPRREGSGSRRTSGG